MYAQINYTEKVGNGPFTIAEIGCFLTAFCNLLTRFNVSVDPVTLNNYFIAHNDYLSDPADGSGVRDDLSYNSVTAYNSGVVVHSTGSSGWPSSNNSIVKFSYKENGKPMTHFCLVDNASTHSIVDSYDGVVKAPAQYQAKYGTPVAWATYSGPTVQAVVTPQTVATPAVSAPEGQYYIATPIPGYSDSNDAANHINPRATVPIGNYSIYSQAHGMINVTVKSDEPGSWINPSDNHVVQPQVETPAPAKPTAPAGAVTAESPIYEPIVTTVPGYSTANGAYNHDAKLRGKDVEPGSNYFQYNTKYGMVNVTKASGIPGSWINPADNVVGKIYSEPTVAVAEPAAAVEETVTAAPASTIDTSWQSTYVSFPTPMQFKATRNLQVHDLSEVGGVLSLVEGTSVTAYGTVYKDSVAYYRLRVNTDPNFTMWYCVPKIDSATSTANLLAKPIPPKTVSKSTNSLLDSLKDDAIQFLDIVPKWFNKK